MAKPDWEAIETAYRAGVMSLRDIGALYGVTEGAIRKPRSWSGYAKTVRRYAKMVRKKTRCVPRGSLPAPVLRKSIRSQKPNLPQIRNPKRYAKRLSLIIPLFSPVISMR
ncbi:hypothetical protein GHX70_16905 [Salmonella enterica]|nr:hypothetical protein [Salmonella enterica]